MRRPRRDVCQRLRKTAQRELQEGELLWRQPILLGNDPVRPTRSVSSTAYDEDGFDGLRHLVADRGGVDDDLVVRSSIAPHLVAQHRSDLTRWPRALPRVLLRAVVAAWAGRPASPCHSSSVTRVGTEHAHHVGVQYKAAAISTEQVKKLRVDHRCRHLTVEAFAPSLITGHPGAVRVIQAVELVQQQAALAELDAVFVYAVGETLVQVRHDVWNRRWGWGRPGRQRWPGWGQRR